MKYVYSPILNTLRNNGLSYVLFESEEHKQEHSQSSFAENIRKQKDNGVLSFDASHSSYHAYENPSRAISKDVSKNQNWNASKSTHYANSSTEKASGYGENLDKYVRNAQGLGEGMSNNVHAYASTHAEGGSRVQNRATASSQEITPSQQSVVSPTAFINPIAQKEASIRQSFESFPPAWLKIAERCKIQPLAQGAKRIPKVVWTYAGLEQDLLGIPNKARQNCIRSLIKDLAHPAGTHVFIPYSLVHEDGLSRVEGEGNQTLFTALKEVVSPRVLLLFGSEARDALGISHNKVLRPFQLLRDEKGLLILQMHKPESLMEKPELYAQSLSFLQTYLKFCK